MLEKTDALVLHSFKYGESKMIIDMFTRQHGRVTFVATMPKTSKGRLKKQYFQPLTLLSIECDIRQQAQLQKMRDASILTPLPSLFCNPAKLSISLFLAEFLYHALKGEQQNEPLFDYILSAIEWLDSRQQNYANFHLAFLMHMSRFLGFYPNMESLPHPSGMTDARNVCADYFDLRAAVFCSEPPVHRDFLMPQEASMLRLMMRMDFANMHLFRMNRAQRNRCVEVALQFYRLHLPDFPELRSLQVLQELWS